MTNMAPILILLASIALCRTAPWFISSDAVSSLAGWAPLMGFALCGGAFLPRKAALWLPACAVLLCGVIINILSGFPAVSSHSIVVAACAVAVAAAGAALKKRVSFAALMGTSILSTVLFHLVSNTVSFFTDPGYVKTLTGWWQCQTTGLPAFTPTWVFTLRQLTGDLIFTALFYACCRGTFPVPGLSAAPATVRA
jgi:hypothetical protein